MATKPTKARAHGYSYQGSCTSLPWRIRHSCLRSSRCRPSCISDCVRMSVGFHRVRALCPSRVQADGAPRRVRSDESAHAACCTLDAAWCTLTCMMHAACCTLDAAWCRLTCMMHAACCTLDAAWCTLTCMMHAAGCMQSIARYLDALCAMSRVACLQSCRMLPAHVVWLSMACAACAAHERDEARLAEQQRESARRCGLCREQVVRTAAQKPPMPYEPALERAPCGCGWPDSTFRAKGRPLPSNHRSTGRPSH